MKNKLFLYTTLIIAALTMTSIVSCQKEKTDETPSTQKDASSQEAINRILEFKKHSKSE